MKQLDPKITSETQRKLEALCDLREDDYTKKILLPLFQSMNYQRVDFNGGPYERGRDLIAQRDNPPFGSPYIVYVQSKKIQDPDKIASVQKLDKLILQLRQCLTGNVTDINGNEFKADAVFLACPQQISNRLFEEIKSNLGTSREDRVHLLDGPRVLELINHYNPSLMDVLLDIEDKISSTSGFAPSNAELLEAIKQTSEKDVSRFYNDLSFFVGSIDSNLLMHLDLKVKRYVLDVSGELWSHFEEELQYFKKVYDVWLAKFPLKDMVDLYNKELKEYESDDNQALIEEKSDLLMRKSDSVNLIEEIISTMRSRLERLISTKKISEDQLEVLRERVKELSKGNACNSSKVGEVLKEDFKRVENLREDIAGIEERLDIVSNNLLPKPDYKLYINIEGLDDYVSSRVSRYFNKIRKINASNISKVELRKFLIDTEKTLSFIDDLSTSWLVKEGFTLSFEKRNQDRVSISAHDIFETGHDGRGWRWKNYNIRSLR